MLYLKIILKTIISYFYLLLLMKMMGKREVGQLSLFDLIIILSISDIMVIGLSDIELSLVYNFLPMLIFTLIQIVLSFISLKKKKIRELLDGRESYIISDGILNIKEMKRLRYSMDDLYAQLRGQGVKGVNQIEDAILETSGNLSVFLKNEKIEVSFPLIVSGKIIYENLKKYKIKKEELLKTNIMLKDILFCELVNGKLQYFNY